MRSSNGQTGAGTAEQLRVSGIILDPGNSRSGSAKPHYFVTEQKPTCTKTSGYQSGSDVSAQTHANYKCGGLSGTNIRATLPAELVHRPHNGVFWLDQEEQMKDYLHVGGSGLLRRLVKTSQCNDKRLRD